MPGRKYGSSGVTAEPLNTYLWKKSGGVVMEKRNRAR